MKSGPIKITKITFVNPVKSCIIDDDEPEFITLEEAGLEELADDSAFDCVGLFRHADWFYDNSSGEYEQ